jgi:hypothetical protein
VEESWSWEDVEFGSGAFEYCDSKYKGISYISDPYSEHHLHSEKIFIFIFRISRPAYHSFLISENLSSFSGGGGDSEGQALYQRKGIYYYNGM